MHIRPQLLDTLSDRLTPGGVSGLVLGTAGLGKSTLAGALAARLDAAGHLVLRAQASESETAIGFATLHQVFRGLLPTAAETLVPRQWQALEHAFSLEPGTPDPLTLRVACLTLLSEQAGQRPVVVVLDDAHWADAGSISVLDFLARRLTGESFSLLFLGRPGGTGEALQDCVTFVEHLEPLDPEMAQRLLDDQPTAPTGDRRAVVLEQSAGNPLALVELSADRLSSAPEVPLPQRLARSFGELAQALPPESGFAVLVAAALDTADVDGVELAAALGLSPEVFLPGVHAGLLEGELPHLSFRHPILRSAVYQAASVETRREAHRFLAGHFLSSPDRRLVHLSAAAVAPDPDARDALVAAAEELRSSGRHSDAAKGYALAAQVCPDPTIEAAQLWLLAAAQAADASEPLRALEHARSARARLDDSGTRSAVALFEAGDLLRRGRAGRAHRLLLDAIGQLSEDGSPGQIASAMGDAATAAVHYLGERDAALTLNRAWREAQTAAEPSTVVDLWQQVMAGQTTKARDLRSAIASGEESVASRAAAAAYLDETDQARALLDAAVDAARVRGVPPVDQARILGLLAWTRIDQGLWDDALEAVHAGEELNQQQEDPLLFAAVSSAHAYIAASRAGRQNVRHFAADTLRAIDPQEVRLYAVRARHALGVAASVEGDHDTAWAILSELFGPDGRPVHSRDSGYALADLAYAARRSGRVREARALLAPALAGHVAPVTARLTVILAHARALLAAPTSAEAHFRTALGDPVAAAWPYERARAQLSYAGWLREQGRDAEALPLLELAMQTFGAVGAKNWLASTQEEIRDAGGVVTRAAYDALADLTPAERAVVLLVKEGLSNRAIADRLYLSPRTVESHLYHAYPKVGVKNRAGLQRLLTASSAGAS